MTNSIVELHISLNKGMGEITDWADIEKGKPLYITHNVEVHCGRIKRTGQQIVTKAIPAVDYAAAENFMKEAYVLSSFDHPNVVKLHTCFWSTMKLGMISVVIVMEYCPKGDLQTEIKRRIRDKDFWEESELIRHLKDLVGVLSECESRHLAHRDIKPQNILLSEQHGVDHLKLADFGLMFGNWSESIANDPRTMAGTPQFLSPKLKQAFLQTGTRRKVVHDLFKSDVYSLGLTFLSMAELENVENSDDLGRLQANLNQRIDFLKYSKLKGILYCMLRVDEGERLNFTQLLKYMKCREEETIQRESVNPQVIAFCATYCTYANREGTRYIRHNLNYILNNPPVKERLLFKIYCGESKFINTVSLYRDQLKVYIRNEQFQPFNKLFLAFRVLGYNLQVQFDK